MLYEVITKEKTDGDTAVCNLASVNLAKVHTQEDLKRVVPTAIRMLDNVIDLNFYPLAKVKKTNEKSRSIGLGVMGDRITSYNVCYTKLLRMPGCLMLRSYSMRMTP